MFWQKKNKKYQISRPQVLYKSSFSKRNKKKSKFGPGKAINFILAGIILILAYFFIFSNFYSITNIEVSGNQIVATDDLLNLTNNYLSQKSWFILPNRNIFIFNKNNFKKVVNNFVILDNIKIDKALPNTIKIQIKEKNVALEWGSSGDQFLLDSQGQIIKSLATQSQQGLYAMTSQTQQADSTNSKYLQVLDLSNQPIKLGEFVFKAEDLDFINKLNTWQNSVDYLKFHEIDVPNSFPQFVTVVLDSGGKVDYNLQDSFEAQKQRLSLLIDQKIKKENLAKIDYIDLRLGESIYYKFKDAKPVTAPAAAANTNSLPATPANSNTNSH